MKTTVKKVIVIYCSIKSNHIFAIPEETHREIVGISSQRSLDDYIESKKDFYGNPFKKSENSSFGFQYISKAGGVKIENYKEPIVKNII